MKRAAVFETPLTREYFHHITLLTLSRVCECLSPAIPLIVTFHDNTVVFTDPLTEINPDTCLDERLGQHYRVTDRNLVVHLCLITTKSVDLMHYHLPTLAYSS